MLSPIILFFLYHHVSLVSTLNISVSDSGAYQLSASSGWLLTGSPVRVRVNSTWLNASDGSLVLAGPASTWSGVDEWGGFNATTLSWAAAGEADRVIFETSFLSYADVPAVVFRAAYPGGAQPLGAGAPVPSVNDSDAVSAEFPALRMDGGGADLGFLQWAGTMLNRKGDLGPYRGRWDAASAVAAGLESGPVALLDAAAAASLVLSPASSYMSVSAARSLDGGALAWGPLGSAAALPAGFGYDVVAWYGATLNANMMAWGAALLRRAGKPHGLSRADFANTHLGYNTDNGGYYYYSTGAYANYSDALAAVAAYAASAGIPYKFVLLDSWWYYKATVPPPPGAPAARTPAGVGGVINWTAQSEAPYFTGGAAGVRALVDATGWKIVAHNRYWDRDVVYAAQNGGAWPFFIDAAGDANRMALPLSGEFWSWLLSGAAREWGLATYLQDWLHNEMEGVSALLTDVALGAAWLRQMGAGAAAAGVNVQLCMAYPRHALASVEMPTATQVRASDDHMPGVDAGLQWDLGLSALLAWPLGLAPLKDNFWSTALQPGGTRPGPEATPALHCAAAALSAGAVTPADGVGLSDAPLILRACDAAGRLLQPSRALTAVDAAAAARAFNDSAGAGPVGVVSATYSALGALLWDHVLVANLSAAWVLRPSHLAPTRGDWALRARGGLAPGPPPAAGVGLAAAALAFALNTTTLDAASLRLLAFEEAAGVALAPCGLDDFALWHTAPLLGPSGFALLGELAKWVPVSEARFFDVGADADGAHASLRGQPGEAVDVTWAAPPRAAGAPYAVVTVRCIVADAGVMQVRMPAATCLPSAGQDDA
jgi:hypothetical protein